MAATGTAVVDFGTGSDKATVDIIGQGSILAGSRTEAWIDPTQGATVQHSVDEHIMATTFVGISCSAIVAGTGFTINAVTEEGKLTGTFNLAWAWV